MPSGPLHRADYHLGMVASFLQHKQKRPSISCNGFYSLPLEVRHCQFCRALLILQVSPYPMWETTQRHESQKVRLMAGAILKAGYRPTPHRGQCRPVSATTDSQHQMPSETKPWVPPALTSATQQKLQVSWSTNICTVPHVSN